jgi:hypothetical protein
MGQDRRVCNRRVIELVNINVARNRHKVNLTENQLFDLIPLISTIFESVFSPSQAR